MEEKKSGDTTFGGMEIRERRCGSGGHSTYSAPAEDLVVDVGFFPAVAVVGFTGLAAGFAAAGFADGDGLEVEVPARDGFTALATELLTLATDARRDSVFS